MNSKNLLEKMFPVGTLYAFLYDFKESTETQISKDIKKLNDMIGKWEYFGIMMPGIYFIRKK